ncbi:hypothetical protein B0A49_06253 [Cryomyces minteri]|uniref:Oxidoreductase molybdopterin-binding domain-containing protein n=1 Tax=Cryomyces minteri TaxID=331657 RepID=A0A4U0X1M4_9PEZI|nr:hypothetical protein B0A49_06253 [Cryomyces minteri]
MRNGGEGINLEFYGADIYSKKSQIIDYVVSVPGRKVRLNEVLLAWEMNGRALPKIHGYPLRVVVFGYIGTRSCKWLYKIEAIQGASMAPVQRKEYLHYTPQIGKQNATYSSGFSIQDPPVSSAIMTPIYKDQIVHDSTITLKGWAYSGGGHWHERVEVSADGGTVCIEMPCDPEGWLEFCVRCWDNALNTQPIYVRSAWNWDFHVTSSCHRIKIYSINRSEPATAARLKALEAANIPIVPTTHPLEIDLESDDHWYKETAKRGGRDPVE